MTKHNLPRGIRYVNGKYKVQVQVGDQRKATTCDTYEQAIEAQQQLRQALSAGKQVPTRRVNARTWTLREALDKTLATPPKIGWRGCAYEKQAKLNVEDAIEFMGPDLPIDRIDLDLVERWLASCEAKGNSDSTINRKLSGLSKVIDVAFRYDGIAEKPKLPPLRKEPVGRIRQITEAEEEVMLKLFRQLGQDDVADAVSVLIDTGMRCGELWDVRRDDIDHKQGVLLIYGVEGKGTKNGTYRSVYMTQRVSEIMARRADLPQPFPYGNTWLRHPWDRVRAMMGLSGDKDFSPHVCRHTCASRMVRNGVPLPVVQKWMGHKNIQTTMKYSHLLPTDLAGAVKALETGRYAA